MRSVLRGRASARRTFVAAAVGVLALSMPADGGFILDDFSGVGVPAPWPVERFTTGSTTEIESGLGGVLGGVRMTTLETNSFALPGLDSVAVTIEPDFGVFDYASSVGAVGSVDLAYGSAMNSLDVDFSAEQGIVIDFIAFDRANRASMPTTVTIDDGVGTATLTLEVSKPGPQQVSFVFASFTGISGVDLSNIRSIAIEFEAGAGVDFRLAGIGTAVPAAGTLALLVFGLSVLPVTSSRRRA